VKYFNDNQGSESFVGTLEVNGNIKVSGSFLAMHGSCHFLVDSSERGFTGPKIRENCLSVQCRSR